MIIKNMKDNKQRNILLVIILLLGIGLFAMYDRTRKLSTKLDISEQNTKALADSVRVEKNKYGEVVTSKNVLVTKSKKLKDLNSQLDNELKRTKGKVNQLNIMIAKLGLAVGDTIHDTIRLATEVIYKTGGIKDLKWELDTAFNDSNSRHIAGMTTVKVINKDSLISLGSKLLKDEMTIKIVTGLRKKDGNIETFAKSSYPGFEMLEQQGVILDPKKHPVLKEFTKKKKWGVGPYVGIGFDGNLNSSMQVGFGLNYSLFRF